MTSVLFSGSFKVAGAVDVGKTRSSNQDEIILAHDMGFFGVSDGMGGLERGELASRYVREALPLLLGNVLEDKKNSLSVSDAELELEDAARYLSDRLYEEMNRNSVTMGATLVGVWLVENKAVFVSLGDSRAYILHPYKKIPEQVTEDMNLAGLLLREGAISREEAKNHPGKSRLTAYVGMPAPAAPDIRTIALQRGDRILLCSDGLYGMVPEREIALIMRSSRSPKTVCRRLIDRANQYGGRDNISAVYIRL